MAGMQNLDDVDAGREECRSHREEEHRPDRHQRAGRQRRSIDVELVDAWKSRRRERDEHAKSAGGHQRTERAAADRQQRRFAEEMDHQPRAVGAERRAHRHFLRASDSTNQQQVGDVDTGDQQEQPDRRHERDDRRAKVADDELRQAKRCAVQHALGPGRLSKERAQLVGGGTRRSQSVPGDPPCRSPRSSCPHREPWRARRSTRRRPEENRDPAASHRRS